MAAEVRDNAHEAIGKGRPWGNSRDATQTKGILAEVGIVTSNTHCWLSSECADEGGEAANVKSAIFEHCARYTDDTQSTHPLVFPTALCRALRCDRCLAITTLSNRTLPFHGGNTGSNPVGDAKSNQ
jgi:hypothetical protein